MNQLIYHFPSPGVEGLPDGSEDVVKYRHEAWRSLEKLQKEGLIKSIGVSNFVVKHLEALKRECEVVPALNQIEWHPKCHDDKVHNYCKENNIVLQAYSSLGTSSDTSLRNDPIAIDIAKKLDKSPSQVLLRWATQNGVAIIPKASSVKHLVENMSLNFTIPDDDMETLSRFMQAKRLDWDPNNVI